MAYGLKAGQQYTVSCCLTGLQIGADFFQVFFLSGSHCLIIRKNMKKSPTLKKSRFCSLISKMFTSTQNLNCILYVTLKYYLFADTIVELERALYLKFHLAWNIL